MDYCTNECFSKKEESVILIELSGSLVEERFSVQIEKIGCISTDEKWVLMMIKEMDIRCHFYGEKFSPKVVEKQSGITLKNKIEVGDITKRGGNKGKPSDYGNGELCPPKEFKDKEDFGLYWIALTLSKHIDILRECGADNIDLVIGAWFEEQCNLSFEPEAIKLIGELGIALQVSCYEDY